jgi:hypothetical protein
MKDTPKGTVSAEQIVRSSKSTSKDRGNPSKTPLVRRFAVDSILSENVIRMEVCKLRPGVKRFTDVSGDWGKAYAVDVTKRGYRRTMDIRKGGPEWDSLKESRVYISGAFKEAPVKKKKSKEEDDKPKTYVVDAGYHSIKRVDRHIRGNLERLYVDAMRGD